MKALIKQYSRSILDISGLLLKYRKTIHDVQDPIIESWGLLPLKLGGWGERGSFPASPNFKGKAPGTRLLPWRTKPRRSKQENGKGRRKKKKKHTYSEFCCRQGGRRHVVETCMQQVFLISPSPPLFHPPRSPDLPPSYWGCLQSKPAADDMRDWKLGNLAKRAYMASRSEPVSERNWGLPYNFRSDFPENYCQSRFRDLTIYFCPNLVLGLPKDQPGHNPALREWSEQCLEARGTGIENDDVL